MSYYTFTILLSASVPSSKRSVRYLEDYTKVKNAQIQIEEAIIALTRSVFQKKGKVIFGGHPSISPLVTMVATEFSLNKEIENTNREKGGKPITIYQSKAFETVFPKSTGTLYNLGYSNIVWTEAIANELFNPEIQGKPQCEKSLAEMRRQMIHQPIDAMVCMGGMEGVELEFELFREYHPNKPIFLLNSTGGATAILSRRNHNAKNIVSMNELDYMNKFIKNENTSLFDIIPYSFIAGLIVKKIIESKNYG